MRRQIALRNLRKAWAAKRKKKTVRVKKRPNARMTRGHVALVAPTQLTIVKPICNKYGIASVLHQVKLWCAQNARELNQAGHVWDAAAYKKFVPTLERIQEMARTRQL